MKSTKLLFCLLAYTHVLAAENQTSYFPSYFCSKEESTKEYSTFISHPAAAVTNESHPLIGGLISPLSGNLCLRKVDFIAKGAQDIPLNRVYIAPHMPYSFQKQWDADCYARRIYLIQNYKGWEFFPHRSLLIDPSKKEIHLVNSNGASYTFSTGVNPTLLNTYTINNIDQNEIPSGRHDPRNTRITYQETSATVRSPDGSTGFYSKQSPGLALFLEKEILPNGKVLRYHYTDEGTLSLIESLDPQERYVYASIRVHGTPEEGCYRFTSSNGLEASFLFESRSYQGKFRKGKEKMSYTGATPYLMVAASSPNSRQERITYSDPDCLLHSFFGKNKTFMLSQTGFGQGKSAHYRVDQLLIPVGNGDVLEPLFQMSYQPAVAGEKEGMTTVKNSDETSTLYHFSKNLLPTLIQDFRHDGTLQKEKLYSWDENNWLTSVELKDGHGNLFIRKSYTYDAFGNPTQERVTGDLQGMGGEESYYIEKTYSQDGSNLLLKEETEEGKVTLFEYLPQTNLLTLKLTTTAVRSGSIPASSASARVSVPG